MPFASRPFKHSRVNAVLRIDVVLSICWIDCMLPVRLLDHHSVAQGFRQRLTQSQFSQSIQPWTTVQPGA